MIFWITSGIILITAMILIIAQIIRKRANQSNQYNIIIYQDQLKEIDLDINRGLLNATDGETLRAEIEKKIEKNSDYPASQTTNSSKPGIRRTGISKAIAVVSFMPFASYGLYAYLGSPESSDQPFANRQLESPAEKINGQMIELVAKLKGRLRQNPNELKGWILLGRSLVSLKRFDDASNAFKKAFRIAPNRSDIAASAAETKFMAMDGKFNQEIRYFFKTAAKLNPREHKALFYLGLDSFFSEKFSTAIQYWVDLIAVSPVGAPWIDKVQERLMEAATAGNLKITDFTPRLNSIAKNSNKSRKTSAPKITQEDIRSANEMSIEERETFIRSMVGRLAERLKSEPNDIRGWRRLARAYLVLGEKNKAAAAERRIIELEK